MKRQTLLLIDPCDLFRQQVKDRLSSYPQFYLLGECRNGLEAERMINMQEPDIVIIAVELAGMNGFQVLDEVNELPACVITSKNPVHAMQAFEYNALDYVRTPNSDQRLNVMLDKCVRSLNSQLIQPEGAIHPLVSGPYPKRILIACGKRLKSIAVETITHLEADREYTWIYTIEKEKYLSSHGIGLIESRLDPAVFMRIHRSYIININHIKELYKDITKTFIAMSNDFELNVGRSYVPKIKRLLF